VQPALLHVAGHTAQRREELVEPVVRDAEGAAERVGRERRAQLAGDVALDAFERDGLDLRARFGQRALAGAQAGGLP